MLGRVFVEKLAVEREREGCAADREEPAVIPVRLEVKAPPTFEGDTPRGERRGAGRARAHLSSVQSFAGIRLFKLSSRSISSRSSRAASKLSSSETHRGIVGSTSRASIRMIPSSSSRVAVTSASLRRVTISSPLSWSVRLEMPHRDVALVRVAVKPAVEVAPIGTAAMVRVHALADIKTKLAHLKDHHRERSRFLWRRRAVHQALGAVERVPSSKDWLVILV